jgi:hypothetical protein
VVAIGFTGVFGGWPMRTLGDVSARSGGDGGWVNVVGCDGSAFLPQLSHASEDGQVRISYLVQQPTMGCPGGGEGGRGRWSSLSSFGQSMNSVTQVIRR